MVVDLKKEEGQKFVHKLAATSDIAVESYRPGVAAAFDIGWETLSAINPRLIYCSISGFGAKNPRSAHDLNFVALAGLLDLQRDRAGRPVLPATQIGDMGGALFGALSILAAVIERQKSGKGRRLDIAMSDATRSMMPAAEALYRGTHHTPESFILTGALPNYDVARTADGKYLALAPLEPRFWAGFCEAIGHPELNSRQYDESLRSGVRTTIESAIASKTRAEWEEIFAKFDVCVEPVLSIEEAHERFGDPLLRHPLQTNFPRPSEDVEKLGDGFRDVAEQTGIEPAEIKRLARSGAFSPREKLKKYFAAAVLKLRQGLGS